MRPGRPWAEGPLLPAGWRPDREDPRDTSDDHHWVVVDPAGGIRLADGTTITLRPLLPGDGNLLAAGFDRLSDRSRYRRFLSPVPRLTPSMLSFLTSLDGINHRAWGALIDEPGGPVGAGVVRWVRSRKDPAVADMAVTVIDDYQGRGLGALLQDVAVIDAFACGIERFEGVVLAENIASRRMLARGGARLRAEGGGVLAFTLELRPRMDRLRGSPISIVVATQNRRAELTA
ncbi:MAG TPA: GNAT family N-acetyltransferase [Acidimicrobiia bacterium]|jgi:RimJ/RimL family protein N-acetyltransferase|nr:GNAT family N-acetyltransferase [Acidimicrobiia bacterium]